ncbi:hypothetical protein DH2020_029945 [Rehmannia glutinosa]|uniref:Disease resistance protein n=1 Tax=Rehmannia glutinosa TaxID=99300 RepID=A0ABR0VQR5_REHGL
MAEVALTFAAEKLGDLLMEKVDYLQGVEGQVKWLKGELETMQCFLQDASEKQANQQTIRKWISDIRELAQDAEDIIDTFILKEDPRPAGKMGLLPVPRLPPQPVGEQIKSIRTRLEDLEKSRQRYEIQNLGEGNMVLSRRSEDVESRRRLSPWQKDKHVVGLKEDVELLRDAILMNGEGLSVATIVGMGGSGKSTLARIVYNHAAIADQFDRRAWVCVSSDFNPEEIIKDLVLQLVEPNQQLEVLQIMEKSPLSHLQRMLSERLQGKRYFIVVDDVWEDAHWEDLASAFPDDKDELENIGREILERCDGLPLAITVVGGLLAKQKQSKSEWEKVLRGMTSLLTRRNESSILAVLELSYNNLPPHLKSCFQCLGFFKEDAVIRAKQLVQVWIAQGLVPLTPTEEETMEEI